MAALGDVSTETDVAVPNSSMQTAAAIWPDVSTAMPAESAPTPGAGGFSGYFSFG